MEVDVQPWPVQIESGAVDFDMGQVLVARALKILHALRRKSISAPISQVDEKQNVKPKMNNVEVA